MIGVGDVLDGRYELRRLLGSGGMGAVYRAFDRRLEREVAIKALLPQLAAQRDLLTRFMREARALAGVRHPNIITLHDLLTLDEGVYLVLDLVPGHSLDEEIRRGGPMSWERCVDLGTQVCGGLAAIHAQDVIHRDIKPSNILKEPGGVYRVADFGLARMGGATQMTRTGAGMGTPGYWAPEQASGEATDGRADIFSLGAVLYAAATGYPPLLTDDGPPDPRAVVPGLPDAAAEVVMRAMAPDPAGRYASALEMARALRSSAGLPLNPVTPLPPAETLPPSDAPTVHAETRVAADPRVRARGPGRLAAAAIAVVAVAALAGLGLGSLRDGAPGGAFTPGDPVAAGLGTLGFPDDWITRSGARLAGAELADGLTARPGPGAEESLAVGTTEAAGPTFLPAALLATVGGDLERRDPVRLGNLEGYRYRGLALANGDPLTVVVVPTTGGRVQTIACSAPPGRFAAFAPRCEAVAGTLRLSGANRAIRLGPNERYASAVGTAVDRLNDAVPGLREELAEATTRPGQADAASQLAAAHAAAGNDLRERRPGAEADGLNAALVDALDAVGASYSALAAATADPAAFASAGEVVAGAEDDLRSALRALERAGYEVAEP